MPRFLNTWTGEFEWHPDPTQVTYAILSHVWREPQEGGEQSYYDVRRIQAAVKKGREKSQSPAPVAARLTAYREEGTIFAHPGLSDKIKGFCKVAREAGFRLAWNDACCIDKTSSAELSEAINSMFEWYRLSDMCYVYLADVPCGDVPQNDGSLFSRSRWHLRGWTLQELIAPERIIFLTKTWDVLGTKMSLAMSLETITGVGFDILVGRTMLDSVSVARRMSWAAWRQTTRVEDRAYSLLGIFGLHMSPIYGEGKKAFLRLQEEIIRTIPDQSTFTWGNKCALTGRFSRGGKWLLDRNSLWHHHEAHSGLLANSPTSFPKYSDIILLASSSFAQTLNIPESHVPPVNCIFTPEGVSMRLICLPLSGVPDIRKALQGVQSTGNTCAKCRELGELDTLALLQCLERDEMIGTISMFALPLRRSRREGGGGNRRAFHIGGHFHDEDDDEWSYRTVSIEIGDLAELLRHVRPTVEDVTLLRHHSGPSVLKSLQRSGAFPYLLRHVPFFQYLQQTVFEISPHSTDGLRTLGIDPSPLQVTHSEEEIILETTLAFHRDSGAGPTDVIALRISLTKDWRPWGMKACVSVRRVGIVGSGSEQSSIGASVDPSHHAVVNTPQISDEFLVLDPQNDSHTIILFEVDDMRRRTIVHMEYTVRSKGMWGNWARLLRIGLQHTFASFSAEDWPPSNLWVSIDLSDDFYERDLETSNEHNNVFSSCKSTPLLVSAVREHTVYASQDNVKALRQQNDTQPARTAPDAHHTSSPPCPTSTPPLAHKSRMWWFRLARVVKAIGGQRRTYGSRVHESLGNTGAQHATEDVCGKSPCRRENTTLRAEIEQLKKKNGELSSELATVSSQNGLLASQMEAVLARLEALTGSPGA